MTTTATQDQPNSFRINRKLHDFAMLCSDMVDKMFQGEKKDYCLMSHVIGQSEDGSIVVACLGVPGEDIDRTRELVMSKMLAGEMGDNVVRAVFYGEAWALSATPEQLDAVKKGQSIEFHPERREVVIFDGRDQLGRRLKGSREVTRGTPTTIGPMVFAPPDVTRYLPSTSQSAKH